MQSKIVLFSDGLDSTVAFGKCAACIERKKAFEEEKNEVQRT